MRKLFKAVPPALLAISLAIAAPLGIAACDNQQQNQEGQQGGGGTGSTGGTGGTGGTGQ